MSESHSAEEASSTKAKPFMSFVVLNLKRAQRVKTRLKLIQSKEQLIRNLINCRLR